jgi:hypothetical protein
MGGEALTMAASMMGPLMIYIPGGVFLIQDETFAAG